MIMAMDSATTSRDKSALTRRRLLDAAEALVADEGYAAPSHRSIARRAGVHVALVNYHYGSKEMLLEAVVARRADQLIAAWKRALAQAIAGDEATTEEVLRAYWSPFGTQSALEDGEWRNYLCTVAWLSQAEEGDAWWSHQFGSIERAFREALGRALPGVAPDAIERGFRYARELLDDVLLRRCNKSSPRCNAPPGLRENDVDGLIAFLAAGLDALPIANAPSPTISRNHVSAVSGN